jgi:hypothetical protein
MIYADIDNIKNAISVNETYAKMFDQMKTEVDTFCSNFSDDPSNISRWGHNYFCQKDGGLLIYNTSSPTAHKCEICGEVYSNELLNGVWTYMYRNDAIVKAWMSAFLYKITKETSYLDNVKNIIGFYADHYLEFKLHNKEGEEFDSLEEMSWGCGRIMPQGLNESLLIIRIINALELVKDDLDSEFMNHVKTSIFEEAFKLLKPQVVKIHNISFWSNSCIGVMGLFCENKEMIDFAFESEFSVRQQLQKGVTHDGFWYEGSIHYNFFTLEGVTNLLLFAELYDYDFGEEKQILEKMFKAAYAYAFDNHQLPNPNDGWPNINLKSYSYIYSVATKVFGIDSEVGNILKNILNTNYERGQFPLSRPYYFENSVSLERLILIPEIDPTEAKPIKSESVLFEDSQNCVLKAHGINVFYKFGHNGPSHAHPDKMTTEVIIGDYSLSRDLSNSGYGNQLCNEWHRMSASHNTVVVNGQNHVSTEPGKCLEFEQNFVHAIANDVYDGVNFERLLKISDNTINDEFRVECKEVSDLDYFFHVEAKLISKHTFEKAELNYNENGYQHIDEVNRIITNEPKISMEWELGEYIVTSEIDLNNKALYIGKSPDNPITSKRTTLLIRENSKSTSFKVQWSVRKRG